MIAFLLISTLLVAALTGIGWSVTGRWRPEWGTQVLLVAAGINLAAAWVAFLPVALVRKKRFAYVPQAALAGMTLRILIAAFALLAAMRWGPWDATALSIWMLVFYLSLLAVETAFAVRLVVQADREGKATDK